MTAPIHAGARLPIEVPSSGPFYEGHFPGRPILPGIGVLALALRALAAAGAPPALREIAKLRLRRLVAPGEDLELDVRSFDAEGRLRLDLLRGVEVVANAIVVLGERPSGAPRAGTPRSPEEVVRAADLDDLIPHRPPMRFVERIEAETEEGVTCLGSVPANCAFTEGGRAPALVALELAAQSAAAFEALRRRGDEANAGPRLGYLVGAREVRFARAEVEAGETLTAVVRLSGLAPPLSTYAFEVAAEDGAVASGTVSTWLTATGA